MTFNRDPSLLYPPFAGSLWILMARIKAAGLHFHLFSGLRTWKEQEELYAKGRTAPGEKVTNARPGYSWHNYGLAADLVLDGQTEKPGIQWSWNMKADLNLDGAPDYRQMAEFAHAVGFEAGYYWQRFPDAAHVQITFGLTLVEARELYEEGGTEKVWEFIALNEGGIIKP